MEKSTKLTRTCLSCGLEKPLAAFLQLTGKLGTTYGNICSNCRSSNAKNKLTPDDETRGSSGLKIDSKTRIKMDQFHLEQEQKKQLEKKEHLEKRDKQILEKDTTKERIEKAEKEHRIGFIEAKKTGFLSGTEKNKKKPAQKLKTDKSFLTHHQQALEAQKLEEAQEQELKLSSVDTSQLFLDSQFGELKFQSEIFKRFKDWLGTSANFRTIERLYQTKSDQMKENPAVKNPLIQEIEESKKRSFKSGK